MKSWPPQTHKVQTLYHSAQCISYSLPITTWKNLLVSAMKDPLGQEPCSPSSNYNSRYQPSFMTLHRAHQRLVTQRMNDCKRTNKCECPPVLRIAQQKSGIGREKKEEIFTSVVLKREKPFKLKHKDTLTHTHTRTSEWSSDIYIKLNSMPPSHTKTDQCDCGPDKTLTLCTMDADASGGCTVPFLPISSVWGYRGGSA